MIIIDLINNLALLVALSVLSGFIRKRYRLPQGEKIFQGLLFGSVTVVGMLRPLTTEPGIFFDGRSVMLSLCALFFGPVAAFTAGLMALVCRVWLGGNGTVMGVSTIVSSVALGTLFYHRFPRQTPEVPTSLLWTLGVVVHVAVILLMFCLPAASQGPALKKVALPIALVYPLATVLVGKVLSDQRARIGFLKALYESREALKTTLYSIGDAIVTTDSEGLIRQLNPVAERLLGWSEREAAGKPCEEVFNLVDEADRRTVENPVRRVLREGQTVELADAVCLISARDGILYSIANNSAPIRNREGDLVGVVSVFRDHTSERHAQKALQAEHDRLHAVMKELQESEQRYRILANSGPGLIWTAATDKRCDYVNQSWLTFTGRTFGQETGFGWMESIHADDRDTVLKTYETAFDRREPFDVVYRLRRHDDLYRWVQNSGTPRYDTQGVFLGYIGHCLDITESRQAEENLRRLEWMLTKKPRAPLSESDDDNRGREDLLPLDREGLIVRTVGAKVLANIVEESLDLLGTCAVVFEANGRYAFEAMESAWCRLMDQTTRTLSGETDPGAAATSGRWLCHESCWTKCAKQVVAQRVTLDVVCHAGLRVYAVPVFAHGDVVGVIALGYGDPPHTAERLKTISAVSHLSSSELSKAADAYDARPPYIVEMAKGRLQASAWLIGSLVEARQSEEARTKLEIQLRQAQKMDAIGRLAGGVAHDFNNILQAIIGYGELLTEKFAETDESHEFAKEIVSEGKRAVALTRQLLTFARKQAIDPKVIDLNEAVPLLLKMLRRLLRENIALDWIPDAHRCFVKIDSGQLDQVLTNLTVNARDAIAGVGKVTISTGIERFDEHQCEGSPGASPGRYVVLTVADNGCGMDRATLEQIFEPFFTTKERGKGIGLGLASVYGIVKQNLGQIGVQSSPGNGSAFRICLPEYAVVSETEETRKPQIQHTGHETILMVDDEESLLRAGRRMLEAMGYVVLAAASPDEALRLIKSYPNRIDLLLTDVVMPGMSGRDLWRKIEPDYPSMKCVYMSGFTANIIAQRNPFDKGVNFLQKPFSREDLSNKLREVLSAT